MITCRPVYFVRQNLDTLPRKNATASRERQGDDIRQSALIIKDELARRCDTNVRGVDSCGYRDRLVHQKCHRTSTRSLN
jgi:hypothetical protein